MRFKTYTKQKLTIQAFQYTGINSDLPEDFRANPQAIVDSNGLSIQTLEGVMRVDMGDWVIRGIKGEHYPCKPDIFDKSYQATQEAPNYLPQHMQRVYMEHKELHERLVNLVKFRVNGFPHASQEEKSLLVRQESLMESMEWTLRQRLALYGPSKETKVALIYARSINNVIGQGGKLPWSIPEDMKHFKEVTMGHTVIMGSKTFESLGCKPLEHRKNIVITSDGDKYLGKDIVVRRNLKDAIEFCHQFWDNQVFIIGGKSLIEEGIEYADKVYETIVDQEYPITEGSVTVDTKLAERSDYVLESTYMNTAWGRIDTWVRK